MGFRDYGFRDYGFRDFGFRDYGFRDFGRTPNFWREIQIFGHFSKQKYAVALGIGQVRCETTAQALLSRTVWVSVAALESIV